MHSTPNTLFSPITGVGLKRFGCLMLFSLLFSASFAQVNDGAIERLSERINSVEKVEELYSVRFAVAKYAARKDLSLQQQAALDKVMIQLSDAFKNYNHYRNAADVFRERLDFNNSYLTRYNAFAKDSLISLHKSITASETDRIASLDTEIKNLNASREAVSGLKQRYYTLGGLAAAGTLVLFVLITLAKNRSIKIAEEQIEANRQKLLSNIKQVTSAGMITGSIGFCRDAANSSAEAISKILESTNSKEDKKLFQNEMTALQKALAGFNKLQS